MTTINHFMTEDRTSVTLAFGLQGQVVGTYKAQELEGMIAYLAGLRRQMNPPIERQFIGVWPIDFNYNPGWAVGDDPSKGVSLHVQEPGFGWVNSLLPKEEAAELGRALIQQSKKVPDDAHAKVLESAGLTQAPQSVEAPRLAPAAANG